MSAPTSTADSGASSSGGTGFKFDVAEGTGTGIDPSAGDQGCEKVDFLFVIDNSGSMLDEQQSLIASFDGFIEAIQGTLMAQDYHIMVVDTDAESGGSTA
jgi:hypothetical protein